MVKFGLRLQILLLLGMLLALAFVPLHFAISAYTGLALSRASAESSRALGRTIAAYVAEAQTFRDDERLVDLLEAQIGRRVVAVGVYDEKGELTLSSGSDVAKQALARSVNPTKEAAREWALGDEPLLALTIPGNLGAVTVMVRKDDPNAAALNRLLGLYMSLIALALLVGAYFSLTYWIVRPIDALARAARLVASPSRRLAAPKARSREFQELAQSLALMTDRLAAEEHALRRKVQEVESATRQLQQAQAHLVRSERLASVGQLAAGLAHEIGNPIAAMQGLQDLILEADLVPEQQLDFIKRMRKETERISRILRDLLQFARPGGAGNDYTPGLVEAAVNETLTLVSPQPVLRGIDLALDVFPDLPAVTLGHEQLMQVLLNLILNAAAACGERGRIVVRASAAPAGGVLLSVEDNGPGISPDFLETLFEPFVSSKDVGEGTGLGLSVCRGLIDAAGGSIVLDEHYSGGAKFLVTLPAAPPESKSSGT